MHDVLQGLMACAFLGILAAIVRAVVFGDRSVKKANSEFLSPMEDAQVEHPSAETAARHITDVMIRARGYEVVDRPDDGPVIWRPKGCKHIKFTQEEVIEMEKLA